MAVLQAKRPEIPADADLPGSPRYCLAGYKRLMQVSCGRVGQGGSNT